MRRTTHTPIALALVALAALAPAKTAMAADDGWFAAARAGDLETVRRLAEADADLDATDKYGSTALAMAASNGRVEVVRFLAERGAALDRAETFYGARPIEMAFFNDHREVVLALLEAGAEGREQALEGSLVRDDLEMARAAVAGGPLDASRLAAARQRVAAGGFDETWQELLAAAESRPDPEPPVYALEELHRFTGLFEGWTSDLSIEVVLRDGALYLSIDGERRGRLVVTGESNFRTEDSEVRVSFNGRAGTIEGLVPSGSGLVPQLLRRSVAEPVARAPEIAADGLAAEGARSPAEPTVDWPSFRGTNATGIGDGADVPVHWDPETGDNILWRAEVPGLGNSSPIVWDSRLFLTTAVAVEGEQTIQTGLSGSGQGVEESVEHSWRVLAFDKATGEPIWETEVGRGVPLTRRHFKATQANSTPATDGRYLVAVFPTAGLACLDVDGELLWKHDLGGLNAGAFSDPGQEWGFASSPILWRDRVILQVDVHGGQYLAAWDLASGEELWRTAREVAPSWATPTLIEGPGGSELVVNGSTIHGYDPETGEELWSLGPNSELVIATPVAGDGVTYVSAGYPPVKPIYAVRAGVRGALELEPGAPHESMAWSHDRGGAYMPTPLLYRGLLYVVHHNGRIVAYDADSGDALYKQRFSSGGVFTGSPVAVNGRIYLPTEEGMVYVVEAGPEYVELAVNRMGEPLMASPAVSAGVLYLRTPSQVVAVGRTAGEAVEGEDEPADAAASPAVDANGAEWPQWRGPDRDGRAADAEVAPWPEEGPPVLWRRPIGAGFSSVSVAAGRLFTAWKEDQQELVAALDAATGETVWTQMVDGAFKNERGDGPRSTPTVVGDLLYIMSSSGKLLALGVEDGRRIWREDLVRHFGAVAPNWGFSASPLVVGDLVVVPVGGEKMAAAAFDRFTGDTLWATHLDELGYSSPIVADLAGRRQVVALTGQTVAGYGLDGELLWTEPWPVINGINVATPLVVGDNRIFLSSSYDVGAAVLEIQPDGAGGLEVIEVWRDRVMKNHFQDSVLHEGVIYGFDNAILKAIRAEDGSELWKVRGFGKGQLILVGDRLVVLGERGRLALVEATPEGYRELATTELPEQRYWTPPSLAGGRLYVRTESDLTALDLGAARAAEAAPPDRAEGAPRAASAARTATRPPPATTRGRERDSRKILRAAVDARGSRRAWRRAGAIRVAGRFNRNGRESRFEAWRDGPSRVRYVIRFGGRDEIFVQDGKHAWYQPMRGQPAKVAGEDRRLRQLEADAWLPWRDPWSDASEVEYLGTIDTAQGTLDRVKIVRDWREEWRFDAATGLVAGADLGPDDRTLELHQSDWRDVGGLLLPHYVELSFGTGLYSVAIEEVELDAALPAGIFELEVPSPAPGPSDDDGERGSR